MHKQILCIILLLACLGVTPALSQPTLSLDTVIRSLNQPLQLVHAGDGSKRIFIVQKGGVIRVFDSLYNSLGTFMSVSDLSTTGEQGLLSVAFHPQYASNGFFYTYNNTTSGDLEIARYHNPDPADNVADPATEVIVLPISHPTNSNHNGGELHFGTDGYLYLSTGDGGSGGDPPNNAQTISALLGKILRLDVNTSLTPPYYAIPPGNPYGNLVYALGLRNPFRWSFDSQTQDMWIGDVGQDSYEEINYVPAASTLGTNYGWRCYEGKVPYNTSGCGAIGNYTFPVDTFRTPNPSGAITGGTVYRGQTYLGFKGYYVGAEFYTGVCIKLIYDTPNTTWKRYTQSFATGLADFGEDEEGELYGVSLTTGNVYRIAASGARVYRFKGNGNWNNPSNWTNKTIPPATLPAGSEIVIDPPQGGECVLDVTQTISGGAVFRVVANKSFRVDGGIIIQ